MHFCPCRCINYREENSMHRILIVDFSLYRDVLSKILREQGHEVDICESAYDAMAMLKSRDYDLVIAEVELPGDNAFDLYKYIADQYPYIPTIMTTDKNIDSFFDDIFRQGIGNVLCKPVKKKELVNLAEKLITRRNIFGLENYIDNILDNKRIRISNSKQIKTAIDTLMDAIGEWGFSVENRLALNLVLSEMAINAVYHSHGLTHEKEMRVPVKLQDGQYVDIFFARAADRYGIAITDYNGKLSKKIILESINQVIEQGIMLEAAAVTGADISHAISETGRGIDLVRRLAGEYYFIIKENVRTEIILIFSRSYDDDDVDMFSSLKIIEDPGYE